MMKCVCWIGISLSASTVMAEPGEVHVGRYSALAPVATLEQSEPLTEVIQPPLTAGTTLHDAIHTVLHGSGYQLAPAEISDPALTTLLQQSLPHTQQSLGPITRDRALLTLVGSAFRLVVDRVHRLVSFERMESYRHYQADVVGTTASFAHQSDTDPDLFGWNAAPASEIVPLPEVAHRYPIGRKVKAKTITRRKPPHPMETYGPVRRQETLQSIARRLVQHTSIMPEQMMKELFRKNPQAFYRRNIHSLKTGSVLTVPQPTSLLTLSRQHARQTHGKQALRKAKRGKRA